MQHSPHSNSKFAATRMWNCFFNYLGRLSEDETLSFISSPTVQVLQSIFKFARKRIFFLLKIESGFHLFLFGLKNMNGCSDNSKILYIQQLDHAEKNILENNNFIRAALLYVNISQIFFLKWIIKNICCC